MDRISAAENLSIDFTDGWKLIATSEDQQLTLLDIVYGEPLRYIPAFASQRRLPTTGEVSPQAVQRVVLGWSNDDEAWHLGLMLAPEVAEQRGSRWCELAHWPDPETTLFKELAVQAGRELARTIGCMFNYLEPEVRPVAEAAEDLPAAPQMRQLPLVLNGWRLDQTSTLQLLREAGWGKQPVRQISWYAILIVVYIILSVATLAQRIALPKPEFLPYLGLATAVILLGIIVYLWRHLQQEIDRISFDKARQTISGLRHSITHWQHSMDQVSAVYVSQVVQAKGTKRTIQHAEINLLMQDGVFVNLYTDKLGGEDLETPPEKPVVEEVVPLTIENAHNTLQMTGLWIANVLRKECRYDSRRG